MLDVDVTTAQWVASAQGKAVKVMPYQLQYLPPDYEYRVVFVCRSVAEILDSWTAMGMSGAESAGGGSEAGDVDHASLEARLLRRPHMPTMFVRYGDLTARPAAQASRLVDFLGLPLDAAAMAAAGRRD
jgi:hypothetical protein